MPLTPKGSEIKSAMEEQYGPDKGEQVFYASKNKGTITGVDAAYRADQAYGQSNPVDCDAALDAESEIGADPGKPRPDLEHPQLHPGASTPPEPANAPGDSSGALYGGDVNGGITGGAVRQNWGTNATWPRTSDALPGQVSLRDMLRDGENYWNQWVSRPLGPDQK